MLKFLRKYNKIILVIGGCVLMVAFTVPQLPQLFGGSGFSRKMAVIEGTTVRGERYAELQQDWQIIKQTLGPAPLNIQGLDHYMLLRYEADKYGLIGGQRDGEALIPRYAELAVRSQQFAQFMPEERLNQQIDFITEFLEQRRAAIINQRAAGNAAPVDNALASLHGILRLFQTNATFVPASRPEAINTAIRLYDRAVADIALIPPGDPGPLAQTAREQELQDFFNTYAKQQPADNQYNLSYLRPDALTLEYILVDKPAVERLIDIDPIALRRFYDALPQTERDELGDSFADARQQIEQRFRRQRAEELLGDAAAAARSQLQNSRRRLPNRDEDTGLINLPPDWNDNRPSLDEVAATIRERLPNTAADGNAATDPITTRSQPNRFFTQEEIRTATPDDANNPDNASIAFLEPLAGATLEGEYPAAQILALVPALDNPRPANIPDTFRPQTGLFFERPFLTQNGSLVFVRPLLARPESPPPDWRDIEQRVRRDYARVTLYNENLALKDTFAQALAEGGLEGLTNAYPAVTFTARDAVVSRQSITPDPHTRSPIAPINRPAIRDAIMQLVADWPLTAVPSEDIPAAERVIAVGLPASASVAAAIVTNRYPVTEDQFLDNTDRILRQLNQQALQLTEGQSFFSFEAIADRLDYENLQRDG